MSANAARRLAQRVRAIQEQNVGGCAEARAAMKRLAEIFEQAVDVMEEVGRVEDPELATVWQLAAFELADDFENCWDDPDALGRAIDDAQTVLDTGDVESFRDRLSAMRRNFDEGIGEAENPSNARCARATAVAIETVIEECGDREGRMEEVVDDVFVFVPEGESRPIDELREAVEGILGSSHNPQHTLGGSHSDRY